MRYLCNDTVMLSPFSKKKNITVRVTLKSENIKEPQEVRIYSFFPLNNFHYPRSDMMEQVHRTLSTQSTGWLIMYTSFLSFRSTEQTYPNDHSQNRGSPWFTLSSVRKEKLHTASCIASRVMFTYLTRSRTCLQQRHP